MHSAHIHNSYCKELGVSEWLTHWGRVTHICVSKIIIIGSDNGLSPGRRQTINWNNARILLIGLSGTNFSEILIEIHTFSSKTCIWKCLLEKFGHFVSASMVLATIRDDTWNGARICGLIYYSVVTLYSHQYHGQQACCLLGSKPLPKAMLTFS